MTNTIIKTQPSNKTVQLSHPKKPLFIFEMANNHMGSINHGIHMIKTFAKVKEGFPWEFAFKFQFRDIQTFIHPDYKTRTDIKYVKRFLETQLTPQEFQRLKETATKYGFKTICTGFDEKSIDLIEEMAFDIIKIASCSFTDWPLLERVSLTSKPIMASTAGTNLTDIDNVVSFFTNRKKQLTLMHCVGEYPTPSNNLQLNQIDLFQKRYADIPIGYSTHEHPDNIDAIKLAIAKNVTIFEKHVAVETSEFSKNAYSATPNQTKEWLKSAQKAFQMCEKFNEQKETRSSFSEKELNDLRQFKRGVFIKHPIKKGTIIKEEDIFYAFPNQDNQLLANDISKYTTLTTTHDLKANAPLFKQNVSIENTRKKVYEIVQDIKTLVKKSALFIPGKAELEISHHYGLDKFYEYGITMVTIVNREYCKKYILVLPGQNHPEQYHKLKEETFILLYGELELILNGKLKTLKMGDILTISPNQKHAFSTKNGCIIEEISSTHYQDDSYYSDSYIMKNKSRKTVLNYWIGE